MAEGKAFDYQNPKREVTSPDDPQSATLGAPYPRHLHKFVPLNADGEPTKNDTVIVAWAGKTPIHNEFVVAGSPSEEDAAIADGYSALPVLKAPEKAKK